MLSLFFFAGTFLLMVKNNYIFKFVGVFPKQFLGKKFLRNRYFKNDKSIQRKYQQELIKLRDDIERLKENVNLSHSPKRRRISGCLTVSSPECKIDNERQRSNLGTISFDSFKNSIKLSNIFNCHKELVNSIDYLIFDNRQIICSGSNDCTINLFDFDIKKEINKIILSKHVECAKFSKYNYHNNKKNNNVRLCDVGESKLLNIFTEHIFNGHRAAFYDIEYSPFMDIVCSASYDHTILFGVLKSISKIIVSIQVEMKTMVLNVLNL
ncbi:hypothetical protein RFI_00325 [Reticulomyxa filosa]|uniref:Uncharacterized protein n=1 Tax=Reticulomyxa filosa TaxID=46433 RepID=X6PGC1_RETFI|nr:hypothetical protein RFI_00325 [Reticulomyxa filosa]|eukprot:ETO36737.1 hypothetical protein RFI_00325 [Reticulomyxa filosa]